VDINPVKFIKDNVGIDDLGNLVSHAKKGEWGSAAKSLGAAALEIGTTVVPVGKLAYAPKAAKAIKGAVGAKAATTAAKETVEANVRGAAVKSAPGPTEIMGQQFKPKAGPIITKPKPAPRPTTKPGELPGAPGYPRQPKPTTKPGELPGAPGYPKPTPKPLPTKPAPKPTTKPTPKPTTKPSTKPTVAPSTKPTTKPSKKPTPAPAGAPGSQWKNLPAAIPALGLAALAGRTLLPKSDKKEEGPWNPSAIV